MLDILAALGTERNDEDFRNNAGVIAGSHRFVVLNGGAFAIHMIIYLATFVK